MGEQTTPPDGSAAPENSIETLRHEIDAELAAAREEAERLRAMADDAAREEAALHKTAEALRASPPSEPEEATPDTPDAPAAPKREEEPADEPTEAAEADAEAATEAPEAPAPRRGLLARVTGFMRRKRP